MKKIKNMNYWQEIIKLFEKEKGSKLDGWELFILSSKIGAREICIDKEEEQAQEFRMRGWLDLLSRSTNIMKMVEKPKIEPSQELKRLHYQALIDYKNNDCSLDTVNWIEKQMK